MEENTFSTGQDKVIEKPRIKKGYYTGRLIEIKKLTDKDGVEKLGKFGNIQRLLIFEVLDENKNPIKQNDKEVSLPFFLNVAYKDEKTGNISSAFTPNSASTKVFSHMGWKFEPKAKINLNDFIGKLVELNIDDHQIKDSAEKQSVIKDINKYEEVINPETQKQIDKIEEMFKSGMISKEGYEMSMKQLKK